MPNYIPNLLAQLQFESTKMEHSLHQHNVPVYGRKVQYEMDTDSLPILSQQAKFSRSSAHYYTTLVP